jgi:hypothetical protein
MDFQISASSAGAFRRITLSLPGEPEQLELSAIITSPSGREEIFLPSPEKILSNATYPQSGGRFVTRIGKGKYQLIFQPKEAGPHELKLIGRISGKPFQKAFQITF